MGFDPEIYKELINTFQGEFEEQVEELTNCLLSLEKPCSEEVSEQLVNQIFRVAHTIKGAARGIEINAVGEISHKMEDVFAIIRQGDISISSDIVDACFNAIDMMKILLDDHVEGRSASVDIAPLVERFASFLEKKNDTTEDHDSKEVSESPSCSDELDQHASSKGESDDDTIKRTVGVDGSAEVIRVDVTKIDQVTALSDELQAIKLEVDDYYDEVRSLKSMIENVSTFWHMASSINYKNADVQSHDDLASVLQSGFEEIGFAESLLMRMYSNLNNTSRGLGLVTSSLQDKVRTLRLVPIGTVLTPLMRSARDVARELNKKVNLTISGEDIRIDRSVLAQAKDPLMHLLRNAIDHGIEDQKAREDNGKPIDGIIHIDVKSESDHIIIEMTDDGAGIDVENILSIAKRKKLLSEEELSGLTNEEILKLIFRPGFSTKEIITTISGRGVGLDVVMANVQSLKGDVDIRTEVGKGTTFILRLPLTLISDRGVIVKTNRQEFAIPTTSVSRILSVGIDEVSQVESGLSIMFDGKPIPMKQLATALGMSPISTRSKSIPVVVVNKGWQIVALQVEEILGEREIVVKHLSSPLVSVKNVSGATLTGRGEVIIVLNPAQLVKSAMECGYNITQTINLAEVGDQESGSGSRILVVDDSITTRTLESNILKIQGYSVDSCVDGEDAWQRINQEPYDLIITDVEMPRMNGFELTRMVKNDERFKRIPVVIVTSLESDDDKRKGIEVGADAYIVKNKFETKALLQTVEQLL